MDKNVLKALLREKFELFIKKVYQTVDGSQPYIPAPYIQIIADKLELCRKRKIKRLIITLPPRSLKTTIASVAFPAYLLGKNPKERILCLGHSESLVKKASRDTRKVLTDPWFQEIFPNTKLNPFKKNEDELETTDNGYRIAAVYNNSVRGKGGNIIIIDDPQTSDIVTSETIRNKSNELFDNTVMSRLNNKKEDVIIIVTQRLHPEDLTAYVQKYGDWEILSLPAIAEQDEEFVLSNGKKIIRKQGEVLNDKTEPLEILEKLKQSLGIHIFSAQWQQRPIPMESDIIDYKNFRIYKTLPKEPDLILQSWDIAVTDGKDSDYSACTTAAVIDGCYYIQDVTVVKYKPVNLIKFIKYMYLDYKVDSLIVEKTSVSETIIDELDNDGLHLITYTPTKSKVDRALAQNFKIASGRVYLPEKADWLDDFKTEILIFPNGKNDDVPDSFFQLLAHKIAYIDTNIISNQIASEENNRALMQYYGINPHDPFAKQHLEIFKRLFHKK